MKYSFKNIDVKNIIEKIKMLPINLSKLNECVIKNEIIECKKIKDKHTVK